MHANILKLQVVTDYKIKQRIDRALYGLLAASSYCNLDISMLIISVAEIYAKLFSRRT